MVGGGIHTAIRRAIMLRISALAAFAVMAVPGFALAACPAFTDLSNTLLKPPPVATEARNPYHYREWIYQEFPFHGLEHVNSVAAWAIHVVQRSTNGTHGNLVLAIDRAVYTTTEGKHIDVIGGLWPQQIIVAYAQSTDVAFDIWSNPPLLSMTESIAALAPCGELGPAVYPRNWAAARRELAPVNSPRSIYVKEIRDAGVANASFNGYNQDIADAPDEDAARRRAGDLGRIRHRQLRQHHRLPLP